MCFRRLPRAVFACFCVFIGANQSLHAAPTQPSTICANDLKTASASSSLLVIRAERLPPSTAMNTKEVVTCSLNIFRYDVHIQSQTTISNPPSPLTALFPAAPTSSSGSGAGAGAGGAPPHLAGAGGPAPADDYPTLLAAVNKALSDTQTRATDFAVSQAEAGAKLGCFTDLIRLYPSILLTQDQLTSLKARLSGTGPCSTFVDPDWNAASMNGVQQQISNVIALNTRLAIFQASPAYNTWLTTAGANTAGLTSLYAALYTTTASILTTLQGIVSSSTLAAYNSNLQALGDWNARVAYANSPTAPWDQSITLPCRAQWFGKTDGQTVTLQYVDISQTAPTAQSQALFTNTCLASLTVSTGLGISTVRNSTYAFTPKTDYTQNPPVTTQVIGYATNQAVVPIFVGQMNYAYFQRSVGLHISGGAGIGSASGGTTGDLFLGNAISFFHRAVFVTPSAHFTQRQSLSTGYAVGDAQGSLTSVPTNSGWKTGFAVTVTLPVLQ